MMALQSSKIASSQHRLVYPLTSRLALFALFLLVAVETSFAATPGILDLRTTQSPDAEESLSTSSSSSLDCSLRRRGSDPAASVAVPYGGISTAEDSDYSIDGGAVGEGQSGRHYQKAQPQQQYHHRHQEERVWRRTEEDHEGWRRADDSTLGQHHGHRPDRRRGGGGGGAPFAPAGRRPCRAIDAETVSLALRMTCEMNRRLRCGTADVGRRRRSGMRIRASAGSAGGWDRGDIRSGGARVLPFLHEEVIEKAEEEGAEGGGKGNGGGDRSYGSIGAGGAVLPYGHPQFQATHLHSPQHRATFRIRRMIPEERRASEVKEPTVFHAVRAVRPPALAEGRSRGVQRWGPDLQPFIETLCGALGCSISSSSDDSDNDKNGVGRNNSSSSLVLALAMIYLDRACSVETDRTNPFFPGGQFAQCPFLSPQTVHRSALTAMVLACRALRGETDFADPSVTRRYAAMLEKFGLGMVVTEEELGMMERHMLGALGMGGMGVEADRLELFLGAWGLTFFHRHDDKARQRQWGGLDESAHRVSAPEQDDVFSEHTSGQPFPGDWAQQQYQ